MIRPPPRSTRTDTLFPYTTLFRSANPTYESAALDIYRYLAGRVEACVAAGIDPARVVVDPGIGFGKTLAHNLQLLEQLALFQGLGCAVLLGASRKGFIGKVWPQAATPKQRLPGSLAAALVGLQTGVQHVRVISEERRVGKECVSTGKSRGSP